MIDNLLKDDFVASDAQVIDSKCCTSCTCTCPCSPWSTILTLSGPNAAPDATNRALAGVVPI